jgi:two-component system sensor histidine kinase TctE
MSASLRVRYFKWLVIQTASIFVALMAVVTIFNVLEMREHADMIEEETEETLAVLGLQLLLFPLAVGSAWIITGKLLGPLQEIVDPAEKICAGHLNERINSNRPDDEIGRLTRTLNAAFDRYDTALARLERFSFDAAHQLRNPLAAIRASGEVALQQARSPDEYRTVIGRMLEDVHRLSRTVDQLLMLARLGHADLRRQFTPVRLAALLRELGGEAQAVCESREITLNLDLPSEDLAVLGSDSLLREAVSNLLDNAMRFTPTGGGITLQLRPADDKNAMLVVQDTGPGMSTDQKSRLFQPFQKGAQRLSDGTGLGLAIVAEIVHLHGGTIELASTSDSTGGCRFHIQLPRG